MNGPNMTDDNSDLERLHQVQNRIRRAARDCGRDPSDIRLVCVTKTIDAVRIKPLLSAGIRDFGENRVQETADKWPELRAAFPDVRLRLIGPLQTNKAKDALRLFDEIQSVDRPKLAYELAAQIKHLSRLPRLSVQVNIGEEPQKSGISPHDADGFIHMCREELGLAIDGLMCIPPANELAAPYFALLRDIADRNGIKNLSMGMTSDFEVAIQMGSTEVRVGSAIFGSR